MRIEVAICTLFLALTSEISFCQQQMTKDDILKTWKEFQKPVIKDSLFRFNIHAQTRATLDDLLRNEVDTLLVYSVRYPGYIALDSDSCSTLDPIHSYFFWRHLGKDFATKVHGKCEGEQSITNKTVIKFVSDHYTEMMDEFFMNAIYSAILDGDELRVSCNIIDHEAKYEIFFQLGDTVSYSHFTENELMNKESLFYDHNHSLVLYKLFELVKDQTKEN